MFAGGVHYRFGVLANQTDKKVLVDLEKLALELVRPEGLASPVCICVRETFVSPPVSGAVVAGNSLALRSEYHLP